MTDARTIPPKPAGPPWALGHAMAVIALRQVADFRRHHTERAELYALSDHELRDIGLSRSEAHTIAAGAYAHDPDSHRTGTGTMTTASFDAIAPPRPIGQRIATAARMARRTLMAGMERLREHYEHGKAIRALMALDDRGLKDIGLHRSGIGSAVRMGRDRPPVTATGRPEQQPSARRR